MKRICGFVIGLALLVMAPVMVNPALATADPGTRAMDYQQATDVVIMRGLSQRGVPFSWAGGGINGPTLGKGTGATTVGFDASGLMQYAYAGAGIKLPRSSGELYRVGQKILPQQARRGDLIFYGPDGTQSVAMYLGNNQMLEVGDVVQVSPVRANGMTPYLVRVLGTQQTPLQQAPCCSRLRCSRHLQQAPLQQAPAQQAPVQQAPLQQAPVAAGAGPAGAGPAGAGAAGTVAADAVAVAHARRRCSSSPRSRHLSAPRGNPLGAFSAPEHPPPAPPPQRERQGAGGGFR